MAEEKSPVITVDGPTASGKGTVSQLLAQHLGWHFLDSGALYRVLGLAAERHGVAFDNEPALEALASHLDVQFLTKNNNLQASVILEGDDVTDIIRTETVGAAASQVSAFLSVRAALLGRQRHFRQPPGLVADGRDMGTVVFPNADLKFFLTASPEVRAQRRFLQLKGKGINVTLPALEAEIRERDHRDKTRTVSPLKPAKEAICIDTSALDISQVFDKMRQEVARFGVCSL